MFDDERGQILWGVLVVSLLLLIGVPFYVARYQECTRVHPAWYCAQ